MMCSGEKVPWTSLGISRPGSVYLGARVLPMGCASAVGVLQHAHRRLALRSHLSGGAGLLGAFEIRRDAEFLDLERSMWSLYLDDTTLVEILDKRVAKELEGKPSAARAPEKGLPALGNPGVDGEGAGEERSGRKAWGRG